MRVMCLVAWCFACVRSVVFARSRAASGPARHPRGVLCPSGVRPGLLRAVVKTPIRSDPFASPAPDNMPSANSVDAVVRTSESDGRYLIAARDLPQGHAVSCVSAHAIAFSDEMVQRVCAACLRSVQDNLPWKCAACERVFYCSSECLHAHLHHGGLGTMPHKSVCRALRRFEPLARFGRSLESPRLMLEILARRHTLNPGEGQKQADADFDALQHRLPPWIAAASAEQKTAWEAEQQAAWEECCALFREAVAQCAWASLVSDAEWSADGLYAMMSRIDTNAFECCCSAGGGGRDGTDGGGSDEMISCGTALYLGSAPYFNHSCAPTCAPEIGMATLTIKTTAEVTRGTPLTIAYVDSGEWRSVRQRALRDIYGFECQCSRCIEQEGQHRLAELPAACHVIALCLAMLVAAVLLNAST